MLLLLFPLYIAGKNLKANRTTTQHHLPKPGQLNSSASSDKHSKGKLNIDVEQKISKRQHGNVVNGTRKDHDAVKRPEHHFRSKEKSKVDIHGKPGCSGHEKKMQEKKGSTTKKRLHIIKGKRKSHIDIHGVQSSSPVMYSSPDGQDHYLTLRSNHHHHVDGTPSIIQANQQGIHMNSALPSKTFLVTVYGDQIDGAEERIRYALTEEPLKKCHPCKCISTPCKPSEETCRCAKFTNDEHPNEPVSLQVGGQKLILFPNSGRPFGRSGCICPCCLCSCTEPEYEDYNCGCQNSPPVPCPCSSAMNAGTQSASSSSPVYPGTSAVATANGVTSWTEETSSCPCSCCPCACAQPQTYPNYQCGCASQPPTPCPCYNQGWNYYQGATNNVVRSESTSPTAPSYSPYTASIPANNGPVAQTFRSGNYVVESSCNCYCCPCSCPGTEYSAYENSQCSCGPETQAACTCRRSEVQKNKSKKN